MRNPGLYIIRNRATGHAYIGSSTDIKARLRTHRRDLERGTHPNRVLQVAWATYGAGAFEFVEMPWPDAPSERALRLMEQGYLETHKTYLPERGYNQAAASSKSFFQRTTSWRKRTGRG